MTTVTGSDLKSALLALETNTSPRLRPDGGAVAFIRTTDAGESVWLRTDIEEPVAEYDGHSIRDLRWTTDGRRLLFRHSPRGREAWQLAAYDGQVVEIGPAAEFWTAGAELILGVRGRLQQLNLNTPEAAPTEYGELNPGFHRRLVDRALRPRGGVTIHPDGSARLVVDAHELDIPADALADFAVQGFSGDGRFLYLTTSAGLPTRQLVALDTETGETSVRFGADDRDVSSFPIGPDGVWFDPLDGTPDLAAIFAERLRLQPLTTAMHTALAELRQAIPGDPLILDRSIDDDVWLTGVVRDNGPLEYACYRRSTGAVEPLFVNRPDLIGHELPQLTTFSYDTSDGQSIDGYRLAPDTSRRPTVVLVHGGPASRDLWRFHAEAQYLATLGLTSLHLNYRGSRGRGKAFRLAGHGEWGGRMQDDLYDGVAFGIEQGWVDGDRVAFFGSSYGGYASLLAATARPDVVRCAVAISPQCDLAGLASKPPRFWGPIAGAIRNQVQGADELLRARSPYHRLTADCPPLLIAHGVRDPRIPIAEVDDFVAKARELGVPVTYLRFDDEGHSVQSNRNRAELFTAIESFLERHV
ncbi:S9 family peptidase [Kribbella sandramycini]|uniref:Dipeptidyl aminopeptidase/acylaminoacyl peptidase n=1 Tax=Kribbella sandramycini TaxID=60450 RepID=A0A7Y4L2B3_9ACTN|nr:alpha/beta fold hydrolase [Kribbella sandramycini]MBB6566325.1 dipeptidyl aminopeptidase/acylaminoacyl peptidase [Kribbella sandramycini]NOL43013.1 S9 family peptidase [Kribbella sandramycini]